MSRSAVRRLQLHEEKEDMIYINRKKRKKKHKAIHEERHEETHPTASPAETSTQVG